MKVELMKMPAGSKVVPAVANICELSTSSTSPTSTTNTTVVGPNIKNAPTVGVERRCENSECNVVKLVSMVPKRKTAQFITHPSVMEKPMLVNGFTTIFQVDGISAKLSDIKSKSMEQTPRTIFRIMPNTHAHIVNYVVVDAEGESMRKINECDPATMRKLLDSQRVSAEQMLKKLMAGHGTPAHIAQTNSNPPSVSVTSEKPINTATTTKVSLVSNKLATAPQPKSTSSVAVVQGSPIALARVATPPAKPAATEAVKSSSMQMPLRLHPSLKITAISSGSTTVKTATVPKPTPTPLIKAVPLAQLQRKSMVVNKILTATEPKPVETAPAQPAQDYERSQFEKMQQELQELRQTVAILAEAQAKTKSSSSTRPAVEDSGEPTSAKRARLI